MKGWNRLVDSLLLLAGMHAGWLVSGRGLPFWVTGGISFFTILAALAVNVLPSWRWQPTLRLTVLADGVELLLQFLITLSVNAVLLGSTAVCWYRGQMSGWL